jgi:hypothetical protein
MAIAMMELGREIRSMAKVSTDIAMVMYLKESGSVASNQDSALKDTEAQQAIPPMVCLEGMFMKVLYCIHVIIIGPVNINNSITIFIIDILVLLLLYFVFQVNGTII